MLTSCSIIFKFSTRSHVFVPAGVEIDVPDNQGNTPLHFAAKYGHADLCKVLIDRGGSLGRRNKQNQSAYDVADNHVVRQYLLPLVFQTERGGQADYHQQHQQQPVYQQQYHQQSQQPQPINMAPPPPQFTSANYSRPSHVFSASASASLPTLSPAHPFNMASSSGTDGFAVSPPILGGGEGIIPPVYIRQPPSHPVFSGATVAQRASPNIRTFQPGQSYIYIMLKLPLSLVYRWVSLISFGSRTAAQVWPHEHCQQYCSTTHRHELHDTWW
jgi:hypothetical protein